ncbi:MAG: RodZ domain-containing protein [Bryobacteraceae bacterium]|jgi:cytoskeleton protein RodZ
MMSVGETLRQERLRRKVQLQEVSEELKISSRMLEAIEADEYDKLPGGVFAKSFVRQYAGVLGLDEQEVGAQFEQAVQSPELSRLADLRQPRVAARLPRMDDQRFRSGHPRNVLPSLIGVVVVMLICSGVYGWWQRNRQLAATRQEIPRAVEARRAAPAPVAPTQQPSAQTPQPPAAPTPAAPTPAADNAPSASASVATVPPPPAFQPGVPQPLAPDTEPPGTAAVRVELVVTEPVWVSVQRDGRSIYSGELKPKEIRTVSANTEVTVRLGNAGGLTIVLNGKPIPQAGPEGQVRTVQLTSGGFQIVAPEAPDPASAPRAPALLEPL